MSVYDNKDVTVVITCHERKEFVVEAIKSVIKQSFSRERYEIILVIDFKDPDLIEYCRNNEVYYLFTNEAGIGYKMALGIERAKTDIICFLNDDDRFHVDKLRIIYDRFKQSKELTYIHNNQIFINHMGEVIGKNGTTLQQELFFDITDLNFFTARRAMKQHLFFNDSSISVKKNEIAHYGGALKDIHGLQDNFLFYFSIISRKSLLFLPEALTYFRLHSESSSFVNNSKTDKFCLLLKRRLKSIYSILVVHHELISDTFIRNLIYGDLRSTYIQYQIMNCSKCSSPNLDLLAPRYLRIRDFDLTFFLVYSRIFLFILFIAHKLFPKTSKSLLLMQYLRK